MQRFAEPSTWAGISATLATVAPFLTFKPELSWLASGFAAFAGGLAVWIRERPAKSAASRGSKR